MFKKKKFNRALPDLDDKDMKILTTLTFTTGKKRFNELLKLVDLPKSTLSNHLDFLEKERLVKRTVIDAQNVTYELDTENFNGFLKMANLAEEFHKFGIEQVKIFESLSLESQLNNVYHFILLRMLLELKAEIKFTMDNRPDNLLAFKIASGPLLRTYELLFALSCKKDKEKGEKAIEDLDKLISEVNLGNYNGLPRP